MPFPENYAAAAEGIGTGSEESRLVILRPPPEIISPRCLLVIRNVIPPQNTDAVFHARANTV